MPEKIWRLYGAIAVIDFVAIGLSSWIGILQFYGRPPMDIAGYPIWWAGIDGLDVVLGGAIVFLLLKRLRGRRQAWLVLVPSVALGACSGIVGWPISTALNSGWSMPAKYGCAFASIGLSLACVTFLARGLPMLSSTGRGARAVPPADGRPEAPGAYLPAVEAEREQLVVAGEHRQPEVGVSRAPVDRAADDRRSGDHGATG